MEKFSEPITSGKGIPRVTPKPVLLAIMCKQCRKIYESPKPIDMEYCTC